ncbi:MAG: extracellular solute-binding protein [Alphaproteobacteria bacterium]
MDSLATGTFFDFSAIVHIPHSWKKGDGRTLWRWRTGRVDADQRSPGSPDTPFARRPCPLTAAAPIAKLRSRDPVRAVHGCARQSDRAGRWRWPRPVAAGSRVGAMQQAHGSERRRAPSTAAAASRPDGLNRGELLALLAFIEETRASAESCLHVPAPDPVWRVVLHLVRRHLDGKLVTITSLAAIAGVPYTTALRTIRRLVAAGLIVQQPRSRSGRSFALHPSKALLDHVESFARRIKGLVGEAIGIDTGAPDENGFYFGRAYSAAGIIPPPTANAAAAVKTGILRFSVYPDPVFLIIDEMQDRLRGLTGVAWEIEKFKIDRLRECTLANAVLPVSEIDVLAVDFPWMGEYVGAGVLLPLDDLIARSRLNRLDFHPAAWEAGSYGGRQYGIPIQPTAELLWYRRDLLERRGLPSPTDVDGVLRAARALHRPAIGLNGIVFSAARATPLANTFIHLMGAFGRPPFNLRRIGTYFDVTHIEGEDLRPTFDSEEGRNAATYLKELSAYSPPGLLAMDWDDCATAFAEGQVAMCYNWSCRASAIGRVAGSPAAGNTSFLPHPAGRPGLSRSPIGGSVLAIPANIDPARIDAAWTVIEKLTAPATMKLYVQHGCTVSARFSVSADPEVVAASPVIAVVDRLAQTGQLQIWQRPPVPEFSDTIRVVGTEMHAMLRGDQSPQDSIRRVQHQVDSLMRQHGHY